MKRYLISISTGVIIWLFINIIAYMSVVNYAIREKSALYLYVYDVFLYALIGIVIGVISKVHGWMLGLIFSAIVLAIICLSVLTSDVVKISVDNMGQIAALKQILLSYKNLIIISSSVIGGYFGNRIRFFWGSSGDSI